MRRQPQGNAGRLPAKKKQAGDTGGFDPKEMKELTELMPDLQDALFDDLDNPGGDLGANDDDELLSRLSNFDASMVDQYGPLFDPQRMTEGMDGYLNQQVEADASTLTPEQRQHLRRYHFFLNTYYEAVEDHKLEQVTMAAIQAHHSTMAKAKNRFAMAMELSALMEHIECNAAEEEDDTDPYFPSWMQGMLMLEKRVDEANERYEKSIKETQELLQQQSQRYKAAALLAQPELDVDAFLAETLLPATRPAVSSNGIQTAASEQQDEGSQSSSAQLTTIKQWAELNKEVDQVPSDPIAGFLLDILPEAADARSVYGQIPAEQPKPELLSMYIEDEELYDSEDDENPVESM